MIFGLSILPFLANVAVNPTLPTVTCKLPEFGLVAAQEKEGARFSGGALKAIERAKPVLCQPDWKRAFAPEAIAESVRRITDPSS